MQSVDDGSESEDDDIFFDFNVRGQSQGGQGSASPLDDTLPISSASLNDTQDTIPQSDQDLPPPVQPSSQPLQSQPHSQISQTLSAGSEITFNVRGHGHSSQGSLNTLNDTQDTIPQSDQDVPPPVQPSQPPQSQPPQITQNLSDLSVITFNVRQPSDMSDITFNFRGPGQLQRGHSSANPLNDTHDTLLQSSLNPPPQSSALSPALRALLPDDWDQGSDGLGQADQNSRSSMLRSPWEYSDQSIRILTRMTKLEYLVFVESAIGSREKTRGLNLFAECLMFLIKISHDVSYDLLGALFEVDKSVARRTVYHQCMYYYNNNLNIPSILLGDGSVNAPEVSKLLTTCYNNTEEFYKTFKFEDPTGRGRTAVFLNTDATYLFTQNSSDVEMQKSFFYAPKFAHIVKWLTFTDLSGKILGICPASTSQTPASGDAHIMAAYINLEDNTNTGNYIRTLLRGNDQHFVVLVVDAGFVARVPNAPRSVRDLPTLVDVCEEEGAIILHTSNVQYTYHLQVNSGGHLFKVPRQENCPTLDEATVKFSRLLRKPQEQSFGSLKRMFKMLGAKHIPNSLIQPHARSDHQRFRVAPELATVPKITFFATSICSIYNQTHAGFHLLYFNTQEQQIEAARSFMRRMAVENPLLHTIFNIQFESRSNRGGIWQDLTIGDFTGQQNPINFPRITLDDVNPTAVRICSGPHAITRGLSVLTYVSQLHVKENNISGAGAENIINSLPVFHSVQYLTVAARPDDWDDTIFGPFVPLTFVRSLMPPSNRSATSPQNFHMVVIGFSENGSDRLGLLPPYDRIRCWYCYKCQSLNALCSMDRHLAALLIALSFPEFFKSTAKNVRVLNPVALPTSQCLIALPRAQQSRDIPQQVGRRTRDRRTADTSPLYVYGPLPPPPSGSGQSLALPPPSRNSPAPPASSGPTASSGTTGSSGTSATVISGTTTSSGTTGSLSTTALSGATQPRSSSLDPTSVGGLTMGTRRGRGRGSGSTTGRGRSSGTSRGGGRGSSTGTSRTPRHSSPVPVTARAGNIIMLYPS